jgi:CDP-diacylglycerol---glycerol-3-phosphate 3-phosphatidyltransferase
VVIRLDTIGVAVLFTLASITDYVDGVLARRWDVMCPFGAFLDPVCDKLMVCCVLVLLCERYNRSGIGGIGTGTIVTLPVLIIVARDINVSAVREYMSAYGQRDVVRVGIQGKIKTAVTMLAIIVLTLYDNGSRNQQRTVIERLLASQSLYSLAIGLLYISTLLTITCGSVYVREAVPYCIYFHPLLRIVLPPPPPDEMNQ